MLVYSDSTDQFMGDVRRNVLTSVMQDKYYLMLGRHPGAAEVAAFQNSLPRVGDLIELAQLTDNHIVLEYQIPYNQNRIDCFLFGKDARGQKNVFLIELKQWSSVRSLPDEGNFVETYTGGGSRVVPHPSQQTRGYSEYLRNFVAAFEGDEALTLYSCAYCHNYRREDDAGLYDTVYRDILERYPVYSMQDTMALAGQIRELLQGGSGFEIFNRFMQSPVRPSQKLLDNVAKVVRQEVVFSLLNEQLVAKNLIWSKLRKFEKDHHKTAIIVHGGPGTGKSVIAVNLLADAARRGKRVFYGCKSKPFIEGLKKLVGPDGRMLFSNLYRFLPSKVAENEIDLVLIDEAHRIEHTSNHRFTRPQDKTDMPQVDQLIRCAKTAVFFIDDRQNVRSREIGHSDLIREAAKRLECQLEEVTLETQFRCMGSNDYLLWLESVLGYTKEKRVFDPSGQFDFRIMDSPAEIYRLLAQFEARKPNSARMVAGFCWPWSDHLDRNGKLVNDVVIGDFAMPWETHGKITRPPDGYVNWYAWAYKPEGFKQVGCIYTAQGFEFDYIGVIIGGDLRYDSATDSLVTDITATRDTTLRRDAAGFDMHVRNIYRTLLTRGIKGCYVYCVDEEVRKYLKTRMSVSKLFF
ncbi:MAG TPA: DUF2075 domain-containing protein [bacterium]|nr:DUF2075 domain-containing protein [bacterium]